ncbi:hypothetical protein A1O3_00053 [Capronia epimyces CBS 606.96]|uniref:Myb-like domain-containing protein n=1 Tax=Capronia epimyces CBS 606.96 TaxID=1182542 RepID=W9YPB4_9EURO|nr:uncharacterized protein A1O3_00053 [Capronia epimyces CBS 606.96]EXJ91505.1 hypothetical protein A1O3_00053 [Capronia epimyces CBS 606.96]
MPSRKRAPKRNLVRWSDDLDKGVLLTLQYAAAESGMKLPWARVAEIMGPRFTEGSIVQHLAKLRTIMNAEGLPVPPPLRRGMVTKPPSKVYPNAVSKNKYESVSPMYSGSPEPMTKDCSIYGRPKRNPSEDAEESAKGKGKARAKFSRHGMSEEDEDEESVPELYDSDEDDYVTKKKARKSKGKATKVKAEVQDPPSTPIGQTIKAEQSDESKFSAIAAEVVGPASRTRGIKRDYAVMEATPSEDEAEKVQTAAGEYGEDGADGEDGEDGEVADDAEDELSSEEETEIMDQDGQTAADVAHPESMIDFTQQFPMVANVPYGQIHMVDALAANVNNTEASMFPNSAGLYHPNFLGASFQGLSYGGPFGAPAQFPFGGLPIMNPVAPAAYYGPSLAANTVVPYADSSYGSTRNNSVATAKSVPSLASQSDIEASLSGTASNDLAGSNRQVQSSDATGNFDMAASMPSEDMAWNDNLGTGWLQDDF